MRHLLALTACLPTGLLLAGCAGFPRPGPVAVDPPAEVASTLAPAPSAARLAVTLKPVPLPRPLPWLAPAVSWTPDPAREGEAVAIWLRQPSIGRRPLGVRGRLDGRPVHFVGVGEDWFGMAAAPVEGDGPAVLTLTYRLGYHSTATETRILEIAPREFPATRLSVAPRFSDPPPEARLRIQEERKLIRAVLSRATDRWLPEGAFALPRRSRVTSPFGQRRLFNDQLRSRHTGVDLAGNTGDPVGAAARGQVALTGDFYFAGNAVFVDHGLGVYTGYFHLSRIVVKEGETVERGELLGEVGSTGRVTGPHLHWSLYVNGVSLDASSLLRLALPGSAPATAGR